MGGDSACSKLSNINFAQFLDLVIKWVCLKYLWGTNKKVESCNCFCRREDLSCIGEIIIQYILFVTALIYYYAHVLTVGGLLNKMLKPISELTFSVVDIRKCLRTPSLGFNIIYYRDQLTKILHYNFLPKSKHFAISRSWILVRWSVLTHLFLSFISLIKPLLHNWFTHSLSMHFS